MNRCDSCKNIPRCAICGSSSDSFRHVGVRGTANRLRIPIIDYNVTYDKQPSGIWHYSQSCNHRVYLAATSSIVKYNGGPLWKDGYTWQDIYWGSYYAMPSSSQWMKMPEQVVAHLESDASYSGGLSQYYHDTVNGPNGPFYTVEPYPCAQRCNQCTKDAFDTITQGLSEEMIELKTDMDPGTGWVIGNEEICDYCDANFVCNRIATGEYVNSWYDKSKNACWIGRK